jgi:hypothetical protein
VYGSLKKIEGYLCFSKGFIKDTIGQKERSEQNRKSFSLGIFMNLTFFKVEIDGVERCTCRKL